MHKYSVKALAKLAGVSIRTLHHYDKIGLLSPAERTEKGYRLYGHSELLRLQQILFYKELAFPLKEIADILNDPKFDRLQALQFHHEELQKQSQRLQQLLTTLEKTILHLENEKNMLTDKEIYEGFTPEEKNAMRAEVSKRWGEKELIATEERIHQMGKKGWQDHKAKGEEINQLLAELMDLLPSDTRVQQAVALHFRHLNGFYEVTKERYEGLGKMYVEDERFKVHYDKYRDGLAVFLRDAMWIFCQNNLKVLE